MFKATKGVTSRSTAMQRNGALKSATLVALISAMTTAMAAEASVIYDNGHLARGGHNEIGVISDLAEFNIQYADDFVLSAGTTFNRIVWWGAPAIVNPPHIVDDFSIQLFNDAGGRPADDPFLSLMIGDVAERPSGFPEPFDEDFEYGADVAPITLDLGVTYWISIFNNTIGSSSPLWVWSVAGSGNRYLRSDFTPDWTESDANSNLGFRLVQVPEPPMLMLLLTAVTVSLWFRRSTRRRARLQMRR